MLDGVMGGEVNRLPQFFYRLQNHANSAQAVSQPAMGLCRVGLKMDRFPVVDDGPLLRPTRLER